MPPVDATTIKSELTKAGVEIYRTRGNEVAVAERVRMHLMDSGIRALASGDGSIELVFVARAQRSDAPTRPEADAFTQVRDRVGAEASARNYHEVRSEVVEVSDPHDTSRVLDVWYEVEYRKTCSDIAACIDDVKWALSIERYVL